MKTVLILKGLPASGKSTWAKELVDRSPGKYARVNKDDLRNMLHNGKWSKNNEKLVLKLRDAIILQALEHGQHVIVDDTNLHPKHEENIRKLVEGIAKVEVKEFEVDVEEAVKRDLKRTASVGRDVIESMYNQFLKPPDELYIPPADKDEAIIVDIDGTLAHMNGRGPFDWDRVGEDDVDYSVLKILSSITDRKIILLSGRDGVCRGITEQWLQDNYVPYDHLFMREAGDMRKDSIVKWELFENYVKDNYQIDFILDDRQQVVDMWRSMGLKCFQVAKGNF